MDSGFVKIYGTILRSSIWLESPTTRILWITMLTMADRDGEVAASTKGLAHVANITTEQCEAGLTTLLDPDLDSRTRDNEGRRIEVIDGGWRILNYSKYRELRTTDQVQAALRKQAQRERDKSQDNVTGHDSHAQEVKRLRGLEVKREETALITEILGSDVTVTFGHVWKAYPKRHGGNSRADAEKQYDARIREKVEPLTMLVGTIRYAAHCKAKNIIGTEFVMQARRFLGNARQYEEEWPLSPQLRGAGLSEAEIVEHSKQLFEAEEKRRQEMA